ncbi:MAG: hypothetical protein J7J86_04525 [Bacteroidales bacterium]|nr:hypothetical protein [Bacteroidales bacterium]
MGKLKIKLLAFKNADKNTFDSGKKIIENHLKNIKFEFVDNAQDVLFFITGGSEACSLKLLKKNALNILLSHDESNSYAAATEVKAYCINNNINAALLDIDDDNSIKFLSDYQKIKNILSKLNNQKLGLIGMPSDWLVASDVSENLLKKKFNINLIKFSDTLLFNYKNQSISETFINAFKNNTDKNLSEESKVYSLLKELIIENNLNAITVECFPLVNKYSVTACLALSMLNNENIAAGCEGDLVSITSMMIVKEISGFVPWMANIANIKENKCLFAHCTIQKNLIEDYYLKTHFETGKSLAVKGNFKNDTVTILRFNNNFTKAFIAKGKIVNRPEYNNACRTQIEVLLDDKSIDLLKNSPLGNHHIIIPEDKTNILRLFCKIKEIKTI